MINENSLDINAALNTSSQANSSVCSCELSTRDARCVPTGHERVRPLQAGGCYFAGGNLAISESSRAYLIIQIAATRLIAVYATAVAAHRSSSLVPDLDFHANNAITRRGIMLDCRVDCSSLVPRELAPRNSFAVDTRIG